MLFLHHSISFPTNSFIGNMVLRNQMNPNNITNVPFFLKEYKFTEFRDI